MISASTSARGRLGPGELSRSLVGAVVQESEKDLKVIRECCESVAKGRSGLWKDFYKETKRLLD